MQKPVNFDKTSQSGFIYFLEEVDNKKKFVSPIKQTKRLSKPTKIGITRSRFADDIADASNSVIGQQISSELKMPIISPRKRIQKRIRQLQTGNSSEIQLRTFLVSENLFELESLLHEFFSHFRVRGEWFMFCPAMETLISKTYEEFYDLHGTYYIRDNQQFMAILKLNASTCKVMINHI
jgi:hypothetical protein